MKIQSTDQKGFAHLLLIGFVFAGLVIIGGTGVYVQKAHTRSANLQKQEQLAKEQQLTKQKAQAEALKKQQTEKKTTTQAPVANPPATCTPDTTMYVSTSDGVYLRKDKAQASEKLVLMPNAATLLAGCLDGEWYTAVYGGKTGYVNKAYISTTKPVAASKPSTASPTPTGPTSITVKGNKVVNCTDSMTLWSWGYAQYYSSPDGSAVGTRDFTSLSGKCASTAGWYVSGGYYYRAADLADNPGA
jgi:hypothetical protein